MNKSRVLFLFISYLALLSTHLEANPQLKTLILEEVKEEDKETVDAFFKEVLDTVKGCFDDKVT